MSPRSGNRRGEQAPIPLSVISFKMQSGQSIGPQPVCAVGSFYGAEFEQPGGAEGLAMQAGCRSSRIRLGCGIGIGSLVSDIQIHGLGACHRTGVAGLPLSHTSSSRSDKR